MASTSARVRALRSVEPASFPSSTVRPFQHRWPTRNLFSVLCLLNTLNYMEHYVLSALLPIIQKHFGITDAHGGLLHTAFILTYASSHFCFMYLAPYFQPRRQLCYSCLAWLVFSATSALSSRYWVLLYLRMLVAGCQACFAAAVPLLYMPLACRRPSSGAKWLLCYYITVPLGSACGYMVSGFVFLQNPEASWRWCLLLVPSLLLLTLLVLCCTDAPKFKRPNPKQQGNTKLGKQLGQLYRINSYVLVTAAFMCAQFISSAFNWWLPSYLYRSFRTQNWNLHEVALTLGALKASMSLIGMLLGTRLSQLAQRRGCKRLDPLLCSSSVVLSLPCLLLTLHYAPLHIDLALFFIATGQLALNIYPAVALDMLQYVVPLNRRTLAWTMHTLTLHVCAEATSPYIVGLLANLFEPNANLLGYRTHNSLQRALFLIAFVHIFAIVFFLWSALFVERDRRQAKGFTSAPTYDASEPLPTNTMVTMRSLVELSAGRVHYLVSRYRV